MEREADGRAFRLIGIGAEGLVEGVQADPPDLLDPAAARRAGIEHAIDTVEEEMGPGLLMRGRGFKPRKTD